MAKMNIGKYAFLGGIAIAVLAGIFAGIRNFGLTSVALVILGLIVGYMNVGKRERLEFLVATIALLMLGTAGITTVTALIAKAITLDAGQMLQSILGNLVAFVSPAALIVAIESIWIAEK